MGAGSEDEDAADGQGPNGAARAVSLLSCRQAEGDAEVGGGEKGGRGEEADEKFIWKLYGTSAEL